MSNGSLANAAARLHLSQSAASRQIADLEHSLRLTLFHRDKRRLVPTDAAIRFRSQAQNILAGIAEIPAIAEKIRLGSRASLSVICTPRLSLGVAAPTLSRFCASSSQSHIEVEVLRHHDVERWAATRRFDIGIAGLPLIHQALDIVPLAEVRAAVLLPQGHSLAKRRALTANDLVGERLLGNSPGLKLREQVDELLSRDNGRFACSIEVSSSLLACQLVAEGAGIAIIDALTIGHRMTRDLVLVPLEPAHWWKVGSFRRRDAPESPLAQQFVEAIVETIASLSALPRYAGLIRMLPRN